MTERTAQEKRIIRGDSELRIGFSRAVDYLLVELEEVAKKLSIDPDELLKVLQDRRMGTYDEALKEAVRLHSGYPIV